VLYRGMAWSVTVSFFVFLLSLVCVLSTASCGTFFVPLFFLGLSHCVEIV